MSIEKYNIENNNEEEPDNSVLNYLVEKNKTLINDYHTPDGNYSESCSLIAVDIAKILLNEGKKSEIVFITGKNANESLGPKQYNGRVSWGGHVVCVCEGMIYDPMIGKPLLIEEYINEAFDSEIKMETIVTKNKIEEFVRRGQKH